MLYLKTYMGTSAGVTEIIKGDKFYPGLLHKLAQPPARLFVRGNVAALTAPAVAIVGTRKVSAEGRELTRRIAEDLARAGLIIVSGLAFGADAAAHEGALAARGCTVAVLASGVNNVTPAEHEKLAERIIAAGGAIVSEYAPDEPAYKVRFLERNRIIAGLALATLVTEAPFKSGALVTARHARALKRPVFALPGSPFSVNSQGTNKLIQRGEAALITSGRDIMAALKWTASEAPQTAAMPPAEAATRAVLAALAAGSCDIDHLAKRTNLAIVTLIERLTDLELAGRIKDIGGKRYVKM